MRAKCLITISAIKADSGSYIRRRLRLAHLLPANLNNGTVGHVRKRWYLTASSYEVYFKDWELAIAKKLSSQFLAKHS